MKDAITEMMHGEGALQVDGKVVFRDMGVSTFGNGQKARVTVVIGLIITPPDQPVCEHLHKDSKEYYQEELWLGKMVFQPTDKLHGTHLRGYDANGILTYGDGFDPRCYTRHFPVDTAVRERMEDALRVPEEDD